MFLGSSINFWYNIFIFSMWLPGPSNVPDFYWMIFVCFFSCRYFQFLCLMVFAGWLYSYFGQITGHFYDIWKWKWKELVPSCLHFFYKCSVSVVYWCSCSFLYCTCSFSKAWTQIQCVRVLNPACGMWYQRFAVVRICESGPDWKKG